MAIGRDRHGLNSPMIVRSTTGGPIFVSPDKSRGYVTDVTDVTDVSDVTDVTDVRT